MGLRAEDLDPVELATLLGRQSEESSLIAAARAAVEIVDGRAAAAREHSEIEADTRGGLPTDTGAQRMWEARAETDGLDSRAAVKADELSRAPLPPPEDTGAAEQRAADAAALANSVAEARQWAADEELRERQRYLDGGIPDEYDHDYDHGQTPDHDSVEAAEQCAQR